jgi:nucleotide-binding universal stress UspA family protein
MVEDNMGKILCPTRGGEASLRTQDKVIAIAKERGENILFLYIVDLHFLDKIAAPIVVDVNTDVAEMGEFLLLMAVERASEQGVEAETMTLEGSVREQVKIAAQGEDISLVILGKPSGTESLFVLADLQAFATEIETETGVKVMIV